MCVEKFKPRKCKYCGKEFIPASHRNLYCRRECFCAYRRETERGKVRPVSKKKRSNQELIVDVAKEAKAHGMSYGQYVAFMEHQKNKRK